MKTISRRMSRKATGEWAPYVKELRKRIDGVGKNGKPLMGQEEFGEIFQSAPITVSRWEVGKQDPPGPMLKRLALLAGNFGYRDLETVFRADEPSEDLIADKDRNIVLLLACLMRWKEVDRSSPANRNEEIYRAGRVIFETARNIVADATASEPGPDLARRTLLDEMSRLLQEIHNDEHKFYSATLRAAGVPMYSVGEPDFTAWNEAKEIRTRQLEREARGESPGSEGSTE